MTEETAAGRTHAVRLLRHHRRAQCRQIDAGEPARRLQGLDRQPQGADDARADPRHRHRGRRADRAGRHAGHLQAEAHARPRHGRERLGRSGRRRCGGPADRRPAGPYRRGEGASSRSSSTTKTKAILVINKIDLMSRERLLEVAAEFNGAYPFEQTFMVSALNGSGTAGSSKYLAAEDAGGPVALSGRPGGRRAAALHGRRDDAREDLRAPARGASLCLDGRDRELGRAEGRLRQDRPGDLCRARQPEGHRARQGRPDHQAPRPDGAEEMESAVRAARCTCSCSSRCARTGPRTRSACATWGSTSERHGMAR